MYLTYQQNAHIPWNTRIITNGLLRVSALIAPTSRENFTVYKTVWLQILSYVIHGIITLFI